MFSRCHSGSGASFGVDFSDHDVSIDDHQAVVDLSDPDALTRDRLAYEIQVSIPMKRSSGSELFDGCFIGFSSWAEGSSWVVPPQPASRPMMINSEDHFVRSWWERVMRVPSRR
jgi:hypothetical protein